MIHGTSTNLRPIEQQVIAAWLFKTAVMYALHSEKHAPRARYFENDELRPLMETGRFNRKYQLYGGQQIASWSDAIPSMILQVQV